VAISELRRVRLQLKARFIVPLVLLAPLTRLRVAADYSTVRVVFCVERILRRAFRVSFIGLRWWTGLADVCLPRCGVMVLLSRVDLGRMRDIVVYAPVT
jgi:hypothetical protein